MTVRTGTMTITVGADEPVLVPVDSKILTIAPTVEGFSVTVYISYDYEPFRLVTAPTFEFAADCITISGDGTSTTDRAVACLSYPGGKGNPRTYEQKD